MLSVLTFLHNSLGQHLTAPGGAGGQCVDLANEYLRQCYGLPHIWHNAADWATITLPGWHWEPNGPRNYPPVNALVVWGEAPAVGIGAYGHIAINIDADSNWLLSFDQNWPEGCPCVYVEHNYTGVLGWHIPPTT